ncbi:MAG: DUF1801 domain-containing protein [Phycisphaerales bacterium]|jgi:hypothetical protein|nr:DUF1801 domain-containing protein [Phycisphaerales bacterium]
MAKLKTQLTNKSVQSYIKSLSKERQIDCQTLYDIMKAITKDDGAMWGAEIAGFGSYHYKYASGREGDWFLTGFSSRKQAISVYMVAEFDERNELLEKLGKHKIGKSCLYIKSLEDIHIPTLKKLIRLSAKSLKAKHS